MGEPIRGQGAYKGNIRMGQDEGRKVRRQGMEKYMENYKMGKAGPHWGGESPESLDAWESWPVLRGPGPH